MGKVVVTGTTSFVGVHLARAFAQAGWEVIATHSRGRDEYDGIQAQRLDAASGCTLARLDLRDGEGMAAFVRDVRPDLWVHHAGHATDYGSPDYQLMASLAVNVAPLPALYRALAESGCGGVLVSGSSMEYAASPDANREDETCWPDTPYGLSKLAETLAARQQCLRFGVPTRVARIYIPFGGLDNPRKLLSQVVEGLRRGERVKLSPCRQKRDFIAVGDLAEGYLALARDLERGDFDVFNLCSGTATPLMELLVSLARRMDVDPALLEFGAIPMRPGEPEVSYGCADKARTTLGWSARPVLDAVGDLL